MRLSFSIFLRSTFTAFFLIGVASGVRAQDNLWVSHGPRDAGSVNDIAIADSVAYAATPNGVFRSHDRGETWQQSGFEGESAHVVAQPGAPVVLAVTGTLYASRDRGQSWAPVSGLPSSVMTAGIDPDQLSTIYVADLDTIWKSTDAGMSWRATSLKPGSYYGRAAFAFDSPAVYLLTAESLYKTLDGGVTWTSANPTSGTPRAIAVSATAGTLYAVGQGFCRSADWAATWTCSSSLDTYSYVARIVEVPGDTPETPRLLAGYERGIIVSRDGGATWAPSSDFPDTPATALAYDASGSFVLAGTFTQVFRSEDSGDAWTPFRAGLNAVLIGALALDPQRPSTIWAGGTGPGFIRIGPGLFRSADSGLSWSPATGLPGPGGVSDLVIDPENPRTMYAGSDRIYRTEDGGETWTRSLSNLNSYAYFLALDPADHRRIWAGDDAGINGGGSGLHYSDDGARFRSVPSVTQTIYSILFDPRRPGSIYGGSYGRVVDFGYPQATGGSIFVSRDNGLTFTKGATNFGRRVISMAADPFEDILYAATGSRGVFRSLDGGTTWEAAGGTPFSLHTIIADPVRRGRLYASTGNGVLRSTDGARTWEHIGLTRPSRELVITPDGRRLYAGTSGGVFQLDLERPEPCSPTATRLCLLGSRFQADLVAVDPFSSSTFVARATARNDAFGYFSFPELTGDPTFPEVFVKMVDATSLPGGGHWVFFSSMTSVEYTLRITDTLTGRTNDYPSDGLCGAADVFGFPPVSAGSVEAPALLATAATGSASNEELSLLSGRFRITLSASHPSGSTTVPGAAIAQADRFGYFSLPGLTGNADLPEVFVKMLATSSPPVNSFYFFHSGLTNLPYTVRLVDTVTGIERTFSSDSSDPKRLCGGADVLVFAD